MRIYERLEEGEVERKEEGTRERKRIKVGIHLLGSHMPSPFSLPLLPPLLFVWLLGVFYPHALFILNSSVGFFLPLSVKKHFSSIIFKPTLPVSPSPPSCYISLHVSQSSLLSKLSISALSHAHFVSLYLQSLTPFTHSSSLSRLPLFIATTIT